jgi:hypothetical protein
VRTENIIMRKYKRVLKTNRKNMKATNINRFMKDDRSIYKFSKTMNDLARDRLARMRTRNYSLTSQRN